MNVTRVLGATLLGVGGIGAYSVFTGVDAAHGLDRAGRCHTADARRNETLYQGVMAASLATAGVLAMTGHGADRTGIAHAISKVAAGAGLIGFGGKLAADSRIEDAQNADLEITNARELPKLQHHRSLVPVTD